MSGVSEVLIEKQWASRLKRSVCEIFWDETAKITNRNEVPPIVSTSKYFFLSTYRFGLTFLSVFLSESPPVFIMEFQHLLGDIIAEYFGGDAVNEQSIRENFSILLQLLDEMVDGGFPLTTEITQLKDMILPPSLARRLFANVLSSDNAGYSAAVSQDLPTQAVSKIPWRRADIKYVTNEIYFDLVESVDAILGPDQNIIHANIYGDINTNCRLSGMPDLTLSFSKKNDTRAHSSAGSAGSQLSHRWCSLLIFSSPSFFVYFSLFFFSPARPDLLDDVSLHRCVRINRYLREKVISFVPPDGPFKLLSYRIGAAQAQGQVQMPIYVKPNISYNGSSGRIHIQVGGKNLGGGDKAVTNVVIFIPLPKATRATQWQTPNVGTVRVDTLTQMARWEIGRLPKDKTPTLEGSLTLPADFKPDESPTVRAEFVIKMLAVSGLKVDGLAIRGVGYKPFKGVRSVTQAGKFTIRCADT